MRVSAPVLSTWLGLNLAVGAEVGDMVLPGATVSKSKAPINVLNGGVNSDEMS